LDETIIRCLQRVPADRSPPPLNSSKRSIATTGQRHYHRDGSGDNRVTTPRAAPRRISQWFARQSPVPSWW
jgi:hypothetical protein